MVHQHFMLVPSFTVAQNIVMSREPRRAGIFFDNKRAEEITRELVDEYGLYVDPSAPVQDVSVGVQQRVEILKALYRGADILILDEPTAVLTPQETAELFRVIRHIIEEKNMTVILITHKLGEVMAISDRVGMSAAGLQALGWKIEAEAERKPVDSEFTRRRAKELNRESAAERSPMDETRHVYQRRMSGNG